MNAGKSITVFVRRDKSAWIASVGLSEHTSFHSSTCAARIAAAHHFTVPVERIELLPTGPHTLMATVQPAGSPIAWGVLTACLSAAALSTVLVIVWKAVGV